LSGLASGSSCLRRAGRFAPRPPTGKVPVPTAALAAFTAHARQSAASPGSSDPASRFASVGNPCGSAASSPKFAAKNQRPDSLRNSTDPVAESAREERVAALVLGGGGRVAGADFAAQIALPLGHVAAVRRNADGGGPLRPVPDERTRRAGAVPPVILGEKSNFRCSGLDTASPPPHNYGVARNWQGDNPEAGYR